MNYRVLRFLYDVKNIIKEEKNWCQNHSAENMYGTEVNPYDIYACRWCLSGAIDLVDRRSLIHPLKNNEITGDVTNLLSLIIEPIGFKSIPEFNDSVDHKMVIQLLDNAINYLEKIPVKYS